MRIEDFYWVDSQGLGVCNPSFYPKKNLRVYSFFLLLHPLYPVHSPSLRVSSPHIRFSPSLCASNDQRPYLLRRPFSLPQQYLLWLATISSLAQVCRSRRLHNPLATPPVLPLCQADDLQSQLLRHHCSASLLLLCLAVIVLPAIPHHNHPFNRSPKHRQETKTSINLFHSLPPCRPLSSPDH